MLSKLSPGTGLLSAFAVPSVSSPSFVAGRTQHSPLEQLSTQLIEYIWPHMISKVLKSISFLDMEQTISESSSRLLQRIKLVTKPVSAVWCHLPCSCWRLLPN